MDTWRTGKSILVGLQYQFIRRRSLQWFQKGVSTQGRGHQIMNEELENTQSSRGT